MDLEKLNLVELNAQEVVEVDGGILPLLVIGCVLLLSGCAATKPVVKTSSSGGVAVNGGQVASKATSTCN